jgi:hypothetical protein
MRADRIVGRAKASKTPRTTGKSRAFDSIAAPLSPFGHIGWN